ncbi:MAG: sigma-70 family RNA polymerase sigma factor [Clostridia bacterium]|nr:sigma-70 family RNA polymerase sigma factor [Clostridia bacterium]
MKLLEVNYDEMTDVELVKAFSKGDSNAIGVIFSRYTGFLKSKAASFDCSYYNEDLMQEGKIGLFKAVLHFDESAGVPFSSYATVCAFHEMLKFYKRAVIRQRENEISDTALAEAVDRLSLDDLLIGNEGAEFINKAIESELSDFEKQVLRGYFMKKSYQQIAVELDSKPKAVDNALSRIKKKIAKKLAQRN